MSVLIEVLDSQGRPTDVIQRLATEDVLTVVRDELESLRGGSIVITVQVDDES